MRIRKPWFRKSKNAWYVELDGKQVRLAVGAENEKKALEAYYKLMATGSPNFAKNKLSLTLLCELFLEYASKNLAPASHDLYKRFVTDFQKLYPNVEALAIKPFHVTRWLDQHPTWIGCRFHAISSIKRAFSWALEQGLIDSNPIEKMRKPANGRRERLVSSEEREKILAEVKDKAFRDFLFALQATGCRPSEIAKVTAADLDLTMGIWKLKNHKTYRKTKKARIVYLTPEMVELSKSLCEKIPFGPIFLNTRGKPFSKNAIRCRFRRLREKIPGLDGVVSYCYRHSFATEALVNGVGIAQVSELLGHTNTTMVSKHYSHLAENVSYMRRAVVTATQPNPKS